MFDPYYDTTGPQPELQSRSTEDGWAYRKYMPRYLKQMPAKKTPSGAANPCQAGDEAECTEWLRECLNEMYNR